MKWSPTDDDALMHIVSTSTGKEEALLRLRDHFERRISLDAADKRVRRIEGKSLAACLAGAAPTIPAARDTEPGGLDAETDEDEDAPTLPPPPIKLSHAGDYKRVLILPDTHVPFHDRRAWAIMLRAARVFEPDIVLHLGDLADFYSVSFHSKDPGRKLSLKDEGDEVKRALDPFGALPSVRRKIITLGNHEFRLERYITDKAPELYGLITATEIMGLDERGWESIPYRQSIKLGHVSFTHEEGHAGALAHIKAGATFEGSAVIGHTHAMGKQYWRNAHGVPHVTASFGWLGDFETIDYMHRAKALRWQLGFGIGLLEPNGNMHLHDCPIFDGKAEVLGQLVA